MAIPLVLVTFIRKRRDVPFSWMFVMFGLFIVSCGFTHLMEVITFTTPLYRLSAVVKMITAAASWATVAALIPLMPRALALRSPEALEREVAARTEELRDALRREQEAREEVRRLNATLERRVRERTRALEEANRELESFSYSVSHDLRAPLRHISGFAELLRRRSASLDETTRRHLEIIGDASGRADRLIDDLLAFSRMGRAEMRQSVVDMAALVRDVIAEVEAEFPERAIRWDVGELPAVQGDPAMLRLVVRNLLANAVKYTRPREQAEITVRAEAGPGETIFSIKDNGVGFDMRDGKRLFGVFQRLHDGEFEGTGIGLASVRRIIARHGGRTWAEGAVGLGATFSFSLPHLAAAEKGEPVGAPGGA